MQGQKEENADAAETDDGTSGVKSGIKQSPLPSEDLIDWSCILKKEVLDTDSTSFVPDDGNSFVDLLNTIDSQYKDVIQFAEGGFCRIYKAKSRFLNRMVAVKSLKKHLAQNPEEVRKFIREAKLVAQLDHAGIVSVYDMLKDDDGGVHIAMKLINGKNLSELTYRLA